MAEADGGRNRPKDLEGGRGVEDAQEIRKLTLDAWVIAAVAEEAWNSGDVWRMAAAVPEKKKTTAMRRRLNLARRHGG